MKHINGRGPKNKGKAFEREIVATILEAFPELSQNDVLARSMGDPGQDIIMSEAARAVLPLAMELKRVNKLENLDVKKAFKQAMANCQIGQTPAVIYREDRHESQAIVQLSTLLKLNGVSQIMSLPFLISVTLKWSDLLRLLGGKQ
jgi:hypothetical protein